MARFEEKERGFSIVWRFALMDEGKHDDAEIVTGEAGWFGGD